MVRMVERGVPRMVEKGAPRMVKREVFLYSFFTDWMDKLAIPALAIQAPNSVYTVFNKPLRRTALMSGFENINKE